MVQGRGNAVVGAIMVSLVLLQFADAAIYNVGDSQGWTFNVASWPKGKRFRVGDTIVFNYGSTVHNVVAVNRVGYNQCITPRGSKVYQTGKDQIKLVKGQNYFICSLPSHCQNGMKIAITAV